MTLETEGSATVQPDAGTPDVPASTGAPEGSTPAAATADPFSGLDTGTREWIGKKGIKGVEDLAKTALNAESLIGNSVRVPGADATAEDWEKFYAKAGRPEKADGYEFALPEGLPETVPYDAEFASEFKTWAHEAGLSPRQAQALHDKWIGKVSGLTAAQQQALAADAAKRATAATEGMEQLWKAPASSPEFAAKLQDARRAIDNLGGDKLIAEMQANGLLAEDQTILSPMLMDVFAKAGAALFKEDALVTGGNTPADNPFIKGNLTEMMQVIRSDPNRAQRLIAAAGKTPKDFGWNP
jgi:hypothetical protein